MPAFETKYGAPCWIDLMTSDKARSLTFYAELFGWTAEDAGEEFGHYVNLSSGAARVGGCMENTSDMGAPDQWSVYLAVEDAKATVDAAADAGAFVIVPAMDVGALGTIAVVAHQAAGVAGMWQPAEHTGFGVVAEPGAPAWFELHTRDHDGAVRFYQDVFGWETSVQGDTDEFRYTTLGEGEAARAGIMDASSFLREGVDAEWNVYFSVASADDTLARATALGGTVVDPAEDTPYGRLATLADPTGARFKVVQDLALDATSAPT